MKTNEGITVKEVIESAKKVTGKDFEVVETDRRAGDAEQVSADYSKAKKLLDWEPKYSDIDTIIKTSWEWESR